MADIISTRINLFKAGLQAGQYEIDEGFEAFILSCLTKAGFDKPEIVAPAQPVAQKTKQLNCYNVFMQEKMAELEKQGVAGKDKVNMVAEAWQALSPDEKDAFKAKAKLTTPVPVHSKPNPKKKGPKGLTGWQLFVREKMPTVKANANIIAKERLKKIGELWGELTPAKQTEYVEKANATHTVAAQ